MGVCKPARPSVALNIEQSADCRPRVGSCNKPRRFLRPLRGDNSRWWKQKTGKWQCGHVTITSLVQTCRPQLYRVAVKTEIFAAASPACLYSPGHCSSALELGSFSAGAALARLATLPQPRGSPAAAGWRSQLFAITGLWPPVRPATRLACPN